ncbi:MAG: YjjG family noncanonical pyrimidine nucleotidase [Vicinamibacteria bacterium]
MTRKPSPVRAVLFDLDHTLFDTARTERHSLGVIAKTIPMPLGVRALSIYKTVNDHVWSEYRAGRITSKQLRVLRFHLWLKGLERDPQSAPTLARLYLKEFSSHGHLITGASAALRTIARTDVKLGVVTNGIDKVQRSRLRASGLTSHFPVIVTSEGAGFTKPDPRIMEVALKRLRVTADEALYVGDDPQIDGLAANRAGVRFAWFNPSGQKVKAGAPVRIDHEVAHLRDIRPLI